MFRRHFITIATTLALAMPTVLGAQDNALGAREVSELLSGNTAIGQWEGVQYRSYFGADGTTIYDPQNDEAQIGKWRVNRETGRYESFWDAIGWTAYAVLRTEDGFAWERKGQTYPFDVVEGRQLRD